MILWRIIEEAVISAAISRVVRPRGRNAPYDSLLIPVPSLSKIDRRSYRCLVDNASFVSLRGVDASCSSFDTVMHSPFYRGVHAFQDWRRHARIRQARQTSLNYAAKVLYNIYRSMQTTRLPNAKRMKYIFKCTLPLGHNTAARKNHCAKKSFRSLERNIALYFREKGHEPRLSKLIHPLRILPSPILVASTNGRPPTQPANCVIIFPPVGEKVEKDVRTPRRRD